MRPSSHALRRTSSGQVPSLSYSQATGRISFSAKLWASSRRSFCSSVRVRSTTNAPWCQLGGGKRTRPGFQAVRLTRQSTARVSVPITQLCATRDLSQEGADEQIHPHPDRGEG